MTLRFSGNRDTKRMANDLRARAGKGGRKPDPGLARRRRTNRLGQRVTNDSFYSFSAKRSGSGKVPDRRNNPVEPNFTDIGSTIETAAQEPSLSDHSPRLGTSRERASVHESDPFALGSESPQPTRISLPIDSRSLAIIFRAPDAERSLPPDSSSCPGQPRDTNQHTSLQQAGRARPHENPR